jgi:hypothetical protein
MADEWHRALRAKGIRGPGRCRIGGEAPTFGQGIVPVDKYIVVNTIAYMTSLKPTNFRLEEELLSALQFIKERDGVPVSEQVRRAITAWVEARGVLLKSARQRARPRKRA